MVNCNKLLRNIAQAVATWCAIAPPRGATPRRRSGAEARRIPCPKGGGQEELPHVRGQGQQPRVPDCDSAGTARGATPSPRSGGAAERRDPASEVRGSGQEELPHAPTPEARGGGWEEQPTPKTRGGERGVTPRPRSGATVGRTYPMPLSLRPRAAAGRSNRTSKEPWLRGRRRA